jgi:hypothetical protein
MAQSFECPACGARTRVDQLTAGDGMRCERCRHALKVSGAATPPPPPRRGGSVSSGAGAPPPRRKRQPVGEDGGTGEMPRDQRPAVSTSRGSGPVKVGPSEPPRPPAARRGRERSRSSRPSRLLAWVVALPIALVAVGLPARKAGYLTGQKLLDVIVEHDLGRFVPLLVIVALWALVTAVLVTLFLEGGNWLSTRRAQRRAAVS